MVRMTPFSVIGDVAQSDRPVAANQAWASSCATWPGLMRAIRTLTSSRMVTDVVPHRIHEIKRYRRSIWSDREQWDTVARVTALRAMEGSARQVGNHFADASPLLEGKRFCGKKDVVVDYECRSHRSLPSFRINPHASYCIFSVLSQGKRGRAELPVRRTGWSQENRLNEPVHVRKG